jgi:nucleoside-diphosphate-sugar epimerase
MDINAKRVLISGINGFTGRYVSEEFARNGWQVSGFGQSALELPNYHSISLMDLEALRGLIAKVQPTAVVHLAGIAFAAHNSAIDFYNTHVLGTLNLLSALDSHGAGINKVLLASSSNVYGNVTAGMFSENAALKPFNDYGVSKLAMEYMAWLWREKLPIVIARPFNHTGNGQAPHFLIPKIIRHFRDKASCIELGNLHPRRDYSDVRNVAVAYRLLVESPESKGAVNVCSGVPYSVQDIVRMLKDIAHHDITVTVNPAFVRAGEVDTLYGSRERLESFVGKLDWIPLEATLRWMLDEARTK